MLKRFFLLPFFIAFIFFNLSAYSQVPDTTVKVQAGTPTVKKKKLGDAFFDKDTVHSIRIYFIQCNYWDSLKYYKKISDSLNVNNFMMANIKVDNKMYYSCGIRFKGESSYDFYPGQKKSFRIQFNKFSKKQRLKGLEELNLTNNFKDPTMIREKIYLDILRKNDLPAPRATFTKVYIGDKYWGLYLANENIDDVFLKENFNDSKGNLFQGEPLANFVDYGGHQSSYYNKYVLKTNTKKNDWSDLLKFIKVINDSSGTDQDYVNRLEKIFDLNSCLKAWAINNLIGNVDAYNMFFPHNFFIYHDSSKTNKWHWISLDGNYAFAAWNPSMNYGQLMRMSVLVPDSAPYKDARPLLRGTLERNKIIQKRYVNYAADLFDGDFTPDRINKMVDSLASKIRLFVYADLKKMYSNSDFDTNINTMLGDPNDAGNFIPGIKQYIGDRRLNLEAELGALFIKLQ